ncbi:MAG: DnaJ domain-containing protein [Bacteroidia bacterium]|nr:DnaJ domain-containing protein [Bacteroidia bacterium]
MKDYYKILGVDRNSDDMEIKKAYRKLAFRYHPDVNKDMVAGTMFKEVNEAYATLGNSIKRRHYDMYYSSIDGKNVKINDKYKQDKGRKYGTAYRHKNQAYAYQNYRQTAKRKENQGDFTQLENWMFASLVVIGVIAIILAVRDLVMNEIDVDSFSGILFGLLFMFLLIYSWTQIYRKKKKD